MPLIRMKVLAAMPDPVRKRLAYRTRMLMADDDVFEIGPSDAAMLQKTKWAAQVTATVPRRRGRPPTAASRVEAPPELEEKTVPELREMVEKRGVELPQGYIRKDELIEKLADAEEEAKDQP